MANEIDFTGNYDTEIQNLLEEIAVENGISDYNFKTTDGSMKGDGYNGIITCVTIQGKDKSDKQKTLDLVIKSASKNDTLRNQANIRNLYLREIYMYDTVFPALRTLELEKGLSPCFLMPNFFKAQVADKSETLLLQNLREIDYKLYERRRPMDNDHVSLVMTEYGRLHALAFALRDQHPEKFASVVEIMDDHMVKSITMNNFINNFVQRCIIAQKSLDPVSDREAIKIYEAFPNTIEKFFADLLGSVDNYSVILHGDCWTNNIMFKYTDSGNGPKPTSLCFLDFQISRLGSPVLDLSYFFYTCSPKEIINNLDHYLDIYYNSFSTYLRKLGSNPDKLFPYKVLRQHWKKYARYGLIFALLVIHIMLSENEEVVDFKDATESGTFTNVFDYDIGKVDEYNARAKSIILHFIENNFI